MWSSKPTPPLSVLRSLLHSRLESTIILAQHIWLILEYVDCDLRHILKERRLALAETKSIMFQALSGLAACHKKGCAGVLVVVRVSVVRVDVNRKSMSIEFVIGTSSQRIYYAMPVAQSVICMSK